MTAENSYALRATQRRGWYNGCRCDDRWLFY